MTVTEEARLRLFAKLEEAIGHEEAVAMMELLPPVGWADVATRHDLDARIGLAEMRFTGRFDEMDARVGGRFDEMDAWVGGRIDTLAERVGAEAAAVRADFHAALATSITSQTRVIGLSLFAAIASVSGIVAAFGH